MSRRISRREFLSLAGLATLGTVIAACQPAAPQPADAPAEQVTTAATSAEAPAPAATGKTIIRWQDWPDFQPFLDQVQEMFAAKLPDAQVELEPIGEGFEDKTLTQMVSGTAPDIVAGWGPVFRKWAEKGQLLDLQPLVDKNLTEEQVKDFFAWQWDAMVAHDSKIRFAMPYYVNIVALIYDKNAFDEAGVPYPTKDMDHDTYAEMLRKMTKKDGDKITRYGGYVQAWDYTRFQFHIQAYGGHLVNPDDWTECWLGKPEAQDALEWIRARMWDDRTIAQPLAIETKAETDTWQSGLVATEEAGMGNIMYYGKESQVKWDVTHIPKGPARRATLGTNDGWAIFKGSKVLDQAWKFMEVLVGDDFQKLVITLWATLPNRQSLLPRWKELAIKGVPALESVNLDVCLEILDEGYPMLTEEFKRESEAETLIMAALEKVFQVGGTPVSYFKEVADEVTRVNREE